MTASTAASRPARRRAARGLALVIACAGLLCVASAFAEPPAAGWIRHPEQPFSITANEVTTAQFKACVAAGACDTATADTACNAGKADKDEHPINCINYYGADQVCAYLGGRVCREPEWLAACRGTSGRAFPYGEAFDLAACNVEPMSAGVEGRARGTMPVGAMATCEGGLTGLYDMAGNVSEWVDACKGDYCKFRGAGHLSNEPIDRFAACQDVCSGNQRTLQSGFVGVRCCRDEP